MKIELKTKDNEKLQKLLLKLMEQYNINIPEESDFMTDSFYYDIVISIEQYFEFLKRTQQEKIAEEI